MFFNYKGSFILRDKLIDRIEDKLGDFFEKLPLVIWEYWMIFLLLWWEIRFYRSTRSKYDIIFDSRHLVIRIFRCVFS